MEYLLLLVGLFVIVKASDVLVDAAASLATRAGVPKAVIALTIMAFGTCAPELAISFQSISSGNGSMALANVVGSCIINVFLIIGLAATIHSIRVRKHTITKELPILLLTTVGLIAMVLFRLYLCEVHEIGRIGGVILLMLFSIFMVYIFKYVKETKEDGDDKKAKYGTIKSIIYLLVCLALITVSSDIVCDNAVIIAENLGVSEKIITLVVIVIGTSLPEMVMTVTSAKKNEFEIAVGNIIGTNIFNIGVVLGLPITIFGKLEIVDFNYVDFLVLFLSSMVFYTVAKSDKKITRIEGIIMLLIFAAYYTYCFLH